VWAGCFAGGDDRLRNHGAWIADACPHPAGQDAAADPYTCGRHRDRSAWTGRRDCQHTAPADPSLCAHLYAALPLYFISDTVACARGIAVDSRRHLDAVARVDTLSGARGQASPWAVSPVCDA